ncbi:hypothetical protein HK405_007797 [Cladochytrium tenue]|nr:hypothetical protein HK405_007797 [Cladochytrium tenue]
MFTTAALIAKHDLSNSNYARPSEPSEISVYPAYSVAQDIGVDKHTGGPPITIPQQSERKTRAMDPTLKTDVSLPTPRLVIRSDTSDLQNIHHLLRDQVPAHVAADLAIDVERLHRDFPLKWSDGGGGTGGGSTGAGTALREAFAHISTYADVAIRAVRLVVVAPEPMPLWKRIPSGAATSGHIDILSGAKIHKNRDARDSSASTSQLVEYYVVFSERELFQLDERKAVTPGDVMVMKHPSLFSLRDCLKSEAERGVDAKPAGSLSGDHDPWYYVDEAKRSTELFPSATDSRSQSTPWIFSGIPLLFDVGDRFDLQTYGGVSNKTAFDLLHSSRPATDSSNGPRGTRSNFLAIAVPALSATALKDSLHVIFCTFYTAFDGALFAAHRALVFNSDLNQGDGGGAPAPNPSPPSFDVVVHTSDAIAAASTGAAAFTAFAFLQMAAARAAGIQKLVYHLSEQSPADALAPAPSAHVHKAKQKLDEWRRDCESTDELLRRLQDWLWPSNERS